MTAKQKAGSIEADNTPPEHQSVGTVWPLEARMRDALFDFFQPLGALTARAGPSKGTTGPILASLGSPTSTAPAGGDRGQPTAAQFCVAALRQQIADIEMALAPGGNWEAQLHDVWHRIDELRMERTSAERHLAELRRILEQVQAGSEATEHCAHDGACGAHQE